MYSKIKNYLLKDKRIFAKGFSFYKLFLILIIFSVFGTLHEQIYYMLKTLVKTGEFVWASRTALIYGPFNIIYGVGAVLMILILGRKEHKTITLFIWGALIGGAFEYILSYLQEIITGTISWNYSEYFLNINGRTTIPYMLFWGFVTALLIKILYPFISKNIEKIPYNLGKIVTNIILVFFIIDVSITLLAVTRQQLRQRGIEPISFIGEFCDKHYTDEYLKEVYPNMEKVE